MRRDSLDDLLNHAQVSKDAGNLEQAYISFKEADRLYGLNDAAREQMDSLFSSVDKDKLPGKYSERIGESYPSYDKAPLKFLVINIAFPPQQIGGIELMLWEFVRELLRRGHDVKVLCCDIPEFYVEPDQEVENLESHIDRSLMSFWEWHGGVRQKEDPDEIIRSVCVTHERIIETLDDFQPDCCLIGNIMKLAHAAMIDEITKRNIPAIHAIGTRGPGYLALAMNGSPLHRFAPCSDWLGKELELLDFGEYPMQTLSPGGLLERFYKYHMPDYDKLRIIFASNLTRNKGIDTLIDALVMLHREGIEFVCEVAGNMEHDSDFAEELIAQVESAGIVGKVKFMGFLNSRDLNAAFARANTIVFPSIYDEPFGRSAIEGMAAGLLLLSTGTGGQAEIINDGVNGLLFEKSNPSDLATKLTALLSDIGKWRAMAEQGREDAFKYTSYESVNIIEELYHTIKSEEGRPWTEVVDRKQLKRNEIRSICEIVTTLCHSGKADEADAELDKIESGMTFLPEVIFADGLCSYTKGDPLRAISSFVNTIILEPHYWEPYYYMGEIFRRSNYFKESIKYYEKAHKLNPDNEAIVTVLEEMRIKVAVS